MPSKYSASLNFLFNSLTSSVNSCVLPYFGVGVNFSPLFNNNISASVSFLFDKFIILMSLLIMFISVGVCFLVLGPGPEFDPGSGLSPGPDLKINLCIVTSFCIKVYVYLGRARCSRCFLGFSWGWLSPPCFIQSCFPLVPRWPLW